jgi:hypothetical protein
MNSQLSAKCEIRNNEMSLTDTLLNQKQHKHITSSVETLVEDDNKLLHSGFDHTLLQDHFGDTYWNEDLQEHLVAISSCSVLEFVIHGNGESLELKISKTNGLGESLGPEKVLLQVEIHNRQLQTCSRED